ncbi:hypothetical protein ACWFR5_25805 [Streptomyces sp. NPDC055092]
MDVGVPEWFNNIRQQWSALLGPELAPYVFPISSLDADGHLVTVADTASDCADVLRQAPEILAGIRAVLGPDCPIDGLAPSILRPALLSRTNPMAAPDSPA